MNISEVGINLIIECEDLRTEAYQDSAGIFTIGIGTIKYPDGTDVKQHDTCTQEQAKGWLTSYLQSLVHKLNNLHFNKPLKQSQFDALAVFSYNVGFPELVDSTLYRMARQNPDDERIWKYQKDENGIPIPRSSEFTKWVTAKGKFIPGLMNRRIKESLLYASEII